MIAVRGADFFFQFARFHPILPNAKLISKCAKYKK